MNDSRTVRIIFVSTLTTIIVVVIAISGWLLWPVPVAQFRETPERRGFFRDAFLPTKPAVIWSFSCASGPHCPVVVKGIVYAGEDLGNLFAIDAATGRKLWQHNHGHGQIFTAPTVVGDRVFFTCGQGIAAVSRKDATPLWEFNIPGGAGESSPLPLRNTLFVGGKDGKIYALNMADGSPIWVHDILSDRLKPPSSEFAKRRPLLQSEYARPRVASTDGQTLFQPIFDQSRLVALDCETGELRWSFQAKGWIYGEPTVTDHHVFIGSQDTNMYCLDKQSGNVIWQCPTRSRIEAGSALFNDRLYFGSCDGNLYCVDARDGTVKWTFPTRHSIYSSPLVTRDAVFFGSFDGFFYCLDNETGAEKWKIQPFANSEVASTACTDGRRLYFTTRGVNAIIAIGDAADTPSRVANPSAQSK